MLAWKLSFHFCHRIEMIFLFYIGSSVTEDEIRQAEEKFAESLHLAQMGMHNILDNDVNKKLSKFRLSIFTFYKKISTRWSK